MPANFMEKSATHYLFCVSDTMVLFCNIECTLFLEETEAGF